MTAVQEGPLTPRRSALAAQIRAFGLWDWGISAFSSVILTFVFAAYITTGVATAGIEDPAAAQAATDRASALLSSTQMWAAVAVALLAPLLGSLADTGGHRNTLLRITTLATGVLVALMVTVAMDPAFVLWGCVLIAAAVVTSELALVFVNSVLPQISTEQNRGRISGTAWALGYWGSILCMVLVLVLFVMPGTGLLGITSERGWNLRAIALFTALWIIVFTLPIMRWVPPSPRDPSAPRWTPWDGYRQIGRRLVRTWRDEPQMLHFLVASAVYRDGLGAVFTLAGVIAAGAYGFSTVMIIVFGIAANLIAGVGVFIGGRVEDRVGPRAVIVASLVAVIVLGCVILVAGTAAAFWAAGLALCFFVRPINASSRTLLTRLSDPDRYTENFGLYATSGRAFGFLGTGAFTLAVTHLGGVTMGILGIVAVLLLGLVLFLPVRLGAAGRAPVGPSPAEEREADG
ncbi:MFS transporter [Helcobacillus massiliensis]|uniref:MFS transporter n=1 Tax=Helcobacillus massiliensis TaxID=521392 RepID=UPI002556C695|nr:MFS transporter [Helcobacillus massiliensis]MDK7741956.1 MFS transporter [Helcobacillus massiliensis]WOO93133.1 MFS transporter [Helcobacillus massiliensis]